MNQSDADILTSWHPEAVEEADDAAAWYESRSESAARGFTIQLGQTIVRIVNGPKQFSSCGHQARRALLDDFPYAVIFRETPTIIQIVAIAHGKRRPGYWSHRTF